MTQDKRHGNGANLIIDALLTRMSELDRFSDDECVIAERALLPLDVVVNDEGEFGFVIEAAEYGYDDNGNKRWSVDFAGGVLMLVYDGKNEAVRTIYETEGAKARAYLAKHLGDKKWF
ncbi:hypothetical protein LP123_05965 [Moraxella bovis]|uniref:Uncharacterized protein n=1 Tax=Moraxella bovis TaxID=476 RepID=A0AAX3EXG5_MORBO|nr:hypothetical protein [Moraxella bovis]AWY20088.1 hypothetical protein DQF64_05965 [Moraxella bovis]UYZ74767.1 hypothetical protein LP093_08280 [Moraxella bovis]UYZ79306.1 hypothetical protein LP115_05595 [Moraxella bovis]UYZ80116.1 hypothetical protein LP113_08650 [Moraxella bovis]UYZ87786.1 hypothetical protein LP094_05600 [Moraxella bovis]